MWNSSEPLSDFSKGSQFHSLSDMAHPLFISFPIMVLACVVCGLCLQQDPQVVSVMTKLKGGQLLVQESHLVERQGNWTPSWPGIPIVLKSGVHWHMQRMSGSPLKLHFTGLSQQRNDGHKTLYSSSCKWSSAGWLECSTYVHTANTWQSSCDNMAIFTISFWAGKTNRFSMKIWP